MDFSEIKRSCNIMVNSEWANNIRQEFKYLLHCRAAENNIRGQYLCAYSFRQRNIGEKVNLFGDSWIVEECEPLL